ncbi:ABC transporter permease [Gordonia liuliyuniae]|uniref:ABC transporter permease n=1 Tax=Gordonia liuliyuniae TaxID=2911517 RepID=A0ABS9IXI0_9ACTN|nr:ABC transporter permease [Gordonia liuliyuniae]MCF8590282.1 ABC transporter permease [Gordonia liuliyuniae]
MSAETDEVGATTEMDDEAAAVAKRAKIEGIVRIAIMFLMPLAIVGMMIWGYMGAMHSPTPRDMPIVVSGQDAGGFATALERADSDAVDIRVDVDANSARQRVVDREAVGAVVVNGKTATLFTASGAGASQSTIVTTLVTPAAAAHGLTLQTEDLVPLPADDPAGLGAMFMTTAIVMAGYLPLSMMLSNSPQLLRLRRFLPLLAGWAVLIAGVLALVTCPILHVVPAGRVLPVMGVAILGVVSIGLVQLFFTRIFGAMATLLAMLLLMVLGMPSSNLSISIYTAPPFYDVFHSFLPLPAIGEALRSVLYFSGDGAGKHLMVLGIGGLAGLVLTILVDVRKRRTSKSATVNVTMPSLRGASQPDTPFWRYAALLFFPLAMVTMMITAMLGAMHSPTPKDMPVAVVAESEQQAQVMADGLSQQMPGMFDISVVGSTDEARTQVADRDVVGAFVLPSAAEPQATVITSQAASNSAAQVVDTIFTQVAQAQNMPVVTDDIAPLPDRDSMGTVTMYIAMGWLMAGFMVIIVGANAAPASRPLPKLLPIVGVYSAFMSGVILLIADPLTGSIESGHAWELWATGTIATFCVAMFATVFERLVGMLAIIPVIGILMFLGVPASSGAMSVYMEAPFFRAIHDIIPMGAAVEAARSILYFGGDTLGSAILVFVTWGVISLMVVAIIDRLKPLRTTSEMVEVPHPALGDSYVPKEVEVDLEKARKAPAT